MALRAFYEGINFLVQALTGFRLLAQVPGGRVQDTGSYAQWYLPGRACCHVRRLYDMACQRRQLTGMRGKARMRRRSQAATGSSWPRAEAEVATPSTSVMGTSRCSCSPHIASACARAWVPGT